MYTICNYNKYTYSEGMKERCRDGCRTSLLIAEVVLLQGVPFSQHFFECHAEFDSNVTPEYYHGLHPIVHVKL